MSQVALSIVLCTYNPRHEFLRRAVDSVVAQLPEVPGAEFIIIDNNSSPPLLERNLFNGYPCKILRELRQGLTAARVAGIRAASGNVVLFVDDDNVLHANFLKEVVGAFADPALGLLGGAIEPEYAAEPPLWLPRFEHQLAIRRYAPGLVVETTSLPFTEYFPVGAGFSVRREIALAHVEEGLLSGGLIEGRKGTALSSGEDIDLAFFCLFKGYKLRVQGSLRLTHLIPAGRASEDYTIRIAVSSLESSRELEAKWSPLFGVPVFPIFGMSPVVVMMRVLVHGALGLIWTENKLRARIFWGFLKGQIRARRTAVKSVER